MTASTAVASASRPSATTFRHTSVSVTMPTAARDDEDVRTSAASAFAAAILRAASETEMPASIRSALRGRSAATLRPDRWELRTAPRSMTASLPTDAVSPLLDDLRASCDCWMMSRSARRACDFIGPNSIARRDTKPGSGPSIVAAARQRGSSAAVESSAKEQVGGAKRGQENKKECAF